MVVTASSWKNQDRAPKSNRIISEVACKTTPLVFFNGYYPELLQQSNCKIVTITTDDYGGARKATTDLIQRGHRLIGGVFKSDDIQGVRRFSGYVDALTEANLRIDDDCMIGLIPRPSILPN
jgi:GntR family transcriptional regulator of arabinose operon